MEIVFELTGSGTQFETLRAKAAKSGTNFRMTASETELYAVLAELREAGAKIISITQIKPTLEDFFMELVGRDRARAAAIEVSGQ
jgi:ABC-type multidrug transport system ATPase subunit